MDACIKTGLDVVKICLVKETPLCEKQKICTAQDAITAISHELSLLDREIFCVLNLKTNGDLINFNIVSMGHLIFPLFHQEKFLKAVFFQTQILLLHFTTIHLEIMNHPNAILLLQKSCMKLDNY